MEDIARANSEEAKAFFFLEFIRRVFSGITADDVATLYPLLQKHLKRKTGVALVGRPDAMLGNLIIEFKRDLSQGLDQAKEQLRLYIAILWSDQGKSRIQYLTMASDGINFEVYSPASKKNPGEKVEPADVELSPIDRFSFTEMTAQPEYAFVTLDRYVLFQRTIPPTGEAFAERFGVRSPAYKRVFPMLISAWESAKRSSTALYDEWAKYLRYVYGSDVADESLFLRHTYLATLAKLIVYIYYKNGKLPRSDEEIQGVLMGMAFKERGIQNFLEEDFFSWVTRRESLSVGIRAAKVLLDVLSSFNLIQIDVDILKSLYQELVDPTERHDLGEYYTPDWLAEYIVSETLGSSPTKSVLDPSCGSGSFLVAALHLKQRLLSNTMNDDELITHLANTVLGFDIHPLAVIVSKANYLLAIIPLLRKRSGSFTLPVYMANSIIPPERSQEMDHKVNSYIVKVELPNKRATYLKIPASIAESEDMLDGTVDVIKNYANEIENGLQPDRRQLRNRLESVVHSITTIPDYVESLDVLYGTTESFVDIIHEGKDTIWSFILKNIYRPLFLYKKGVDIIVGNPPWLSFRYIRDVNYQARIKALMKDYGIFPQGKLVTQMELATLFFLRTADYYLTKRGKDGAKEGVISFVMPRSIFAADQHASFREGKGTTGITRIVDLADVSPLFNVPCCVVSGARGAPTKYPVTGVTVSGKVKKRNASYCEAVFGLSFDRTHFVLCSVGERTFLMKGTKPLRFTGRSAYYKKFTQGATIVPKSLWFVEPETGSNFGFDTKRPYMKTSAHAIKESKKPYNDVRVERNIEVKYVYAIVTGSEIVPFGHLELPLAVLPIEPLGSGFRMVKRTEALRNGDVDLAAWLKQVEVIWANKRGKKADRMNIYQRLDYSGGLTKQSPGATYKVLYNTSGTNLVSCVIKQGPFLRQFGDQKLQIQGTIADATAYWYDLDNVDEAFFLCAVLNSSTLNKIVKPMQSAGLFGERHLHKKPLEFPIQTFDPGNIDHFRLSELGRQCTAKVGDVLAKVSYSSLGMIRNKIREAIQTELSEIDLLVASMFKGKSSGLDDYLLSAET